MRTEKEYCLTAMNFVDESGYCGIVGCTGDNHIMESVEPIIVKGNLQDLFAGIIEDLEALKNRWIEHAEQNEIDRLEAIYEAHIKQISDCMDVVNSHSRLYAAQQGEWIDVKERLPEEGKPILVYSDDTIGGIDIVDCFVREVITFTHWMPIPPNPPIK